MFCHLKKILTSVSCFFLFGQISFSQPKQQPPNVIFIICDDLNDYEGVFGGHKQARTPNIDKLAASGVRFMNAQSNAPVCCPSRNSLFTGVYPHASKDFGWTNIRQQPVLKNNKDLMVLFKENGYKTYGTGKLLHNHIPKDFDVWGMNLKHNYGPVYFDGDSLRANPGVPAPYRNIGQIDGSYGRMSDAGISNGIPGEKGWVYGGDKKPFRYISDSDRDLLQDELHIQWAIQQLKEMEAQKTGQPFFMGIGFSRPHTPLHVPDKYFELFPLESLELDNWMVDDEKDTYYTKNITGAIQKKEDDKGPRYYRLLLESYQGNRELALKHFLQAYLACVAFIDDQVGKMMDALNESPFKDNTIIVFTSDHGWQMGEKKYLFKNSPWEESARVPLIVKVPGANPGTKVNHPVSLVDLFPTLMDYADLKGSNKVNDEGGDLGGFSLRPFIEKNETSWKGPNGALSLVANFGVNIPVEKQSFSYRTEDWRYILYGSGDEELYDHKTDPYEWNNRAADPSLKKQKEQLKAEMLNLIKTR